MRWLDGITILHDVMASHHHHGYKFEQALGIGDGPGVLQSMGSQRVTHD